MSDLENVKKLREVTGAGFKDCNLAIKEAKGDLDKAIEILRVKGISKASKRMSRDAKEGVVVVSGDETKISIIEVFFLSPLIATTPSFASLDIFFEALDIPLILSISIALSKLPLDSFIAKLQSLNPAPLASLSFLTFLISVILINSFFILGAKFFI